MKGVGEIFQKTEIFTISCYFLDTAVFIPSKKMGDGSFFQSQLSNMDSTTTIGETHTSKKMIVTNPNASHFTIEAETEVAAVAGGLAGAVAKDSHFTSHFSLNPEEDMGMVNGVDAASTSSSHYRNHNAKSIEPAARPSSRYYY